MSDTAGAGGSANAVNPRGAIRLLNATPGTPDILAPLANEQVTQNFFVDGDYDVHGYGITVQLLRGGTPQYTTVVQVSGTSWTAGFVNVTPLGAWTIKAIGASGHSTRDITVVDNGSEHGPGGDD